MKAPIIPFGTQPMDTEGCHFGKVLFGVERGVKKLCVEVREIYTLGTN